VLLLPSTTAKPTSQNASKECIKSITAQTYSNWEYIIVNNRSTDGTLAIAEKYTTDPRIRVETNSDFLPIIANHNRAFSLISRDSKYCKVVSADDWIFPEALSRMVALGESNPTVGLIGAYQLSGSGDVWYVRNHGLPYSSTVIGGRDMGRAHLLGPRPLDVFGNPTSTMYRADHRWFLESGWCQQPDPTGESPVTTAKPSARYGAI
jgi:glycosyltransferase involved in cell wall biosynthesis